MKIISLKRRLLHSTMVGGAALMALTAAPAVTLLAPTVASAQDYTTGAVAGSVVNSAGMPIAGATVSLRSLEQGFTRTVTTGANGSFRASLVPIGRYELRIEAAGYPASVDPNVVVRVGSESSYTYEMSTAVADANSVEDVIVTGTRRELAFSQGTTGITVDVAEMVTRLPVGRSITDVALLAPRAVSGDSAFGNQPSLGGSSVAENAFYVNGLNITNFDTYVGGATVPFDFYRTVEVKTGGYPAEFGRATGGVINAVTKSGTNEFVVELHGNWTPDGLREQSPDTYLTQNSLGSSESLSFIAEVGGPIIKDRLFAYGLYQWQDSTREVYAKNNRWLSRIEADDPFWGAKIDAYLTDDHRLEVTYFDTSQTEIYTYRNWNPTTGDLSNDVLGSREYTSGGENYVVRYTGNISDWLTLSAAYGVNNDSNAAGAVSDPTAPIAYDYRSGTGIRVSNQFGSTSDYQSTEREFYRVDADMTFSWLGDHHVRMGFDHEDTTLNHVNSTNGDGVYYYWAGDNIFTPEGGSDYIEVYTQIMGGNGVKGKNQAFYIQDAWDITDDFSVQLGLRHDEFTVFNLQGEEVTTLDNNWGPRLGFTLDPFGNGADKFYASYGRYFVPPASNLGFRGADFMVSAYFLPVGGALTLDPVTGLPVGGLGAPLTQDIAADPSAGLTICPEGTPNGVAGLRACSVNGAGLQDPADAKYAFGTKATNEDEFIVGYERQLNDNWTVGAALTYRKLNNVSEDVAVDYLVRRYCAEEFTGAELAACNDQFYGDHQYVIMNPGQDLTFLVREELPDGSRPTLSFSAAEVGIPKARREYRGLEVSFERAFDGVWGLQGSYVLSRSIGNYEGTVLSDNGQDDAGSTILYDHRGLSDGTYGLLPNHRAHQFKLFGSYQVLENLTLGGNLSVMSPRKFGCLGRHPTDSSAADYGASSRYCFDNPATEGVYDPVLVPRGSVFESDWITQVDLSVRYNIPAIGLMRNGLTLRADVFNVFDNDGVNDMVEAGTLSGGGANPNYKAPVGFQQPRYVRLGFDMKF